MVDEPRKLWELLDTNGIRVRARYIRSTANVWADRLSREADRDNGQLDTRVFAYMSGLWGPHSVDRFATMGNAQLPGYNSKSRDPDSESMGCVHLLDARWLADEKKLVNWRNPPKHLLHDLVRKLR
eukprot:jgi/Tetstr1/462289/TSEL_007307.t1